MTKGTPATSTPQLDFMWRLRARDDQHGHLAMPFLEVEERETLNRILNASASKGVTQKVQRQAHSFLVLLGQRDATMRFLTDQERRSLTALTELGTQSEQKSMSGGEFVVILGVLLSAAVAAYLTYKHPANGSAFWVAVWGVLLGCGFIADTRHRSNTKAGSVSAVEGSLAAAIWGVAAATVVLLSGSHHVFAGLAAFLSFLGAGLIGRSVLKLKGGGPLLKVKFTYKND